MNLLMWQTSSQSYERSVEYMQKSKFNPVLTLEYMTTSSENQYFDRKSAKVKPSDLSAIISAFANAEGGTIVIGISDKTKDIEGIHSVGDVKINEFINAPKSTCKPMPMYDVEYLDVINKDGIQDQLLLLHIHFSSEQIVRTTNDSTYLRIGDRTSELKGDNLKNLEYSKGTRQYEDECNPDATIEDLDNTLINEYKKHLGAENIATEHVLKARGFLKERNGKWCLTNAAILLFAENITQFYPNCRIRFVRYNGNMANVGTNINIIKDVSIEQPILKIIDKAKEFIGSQLRDFTALNSQTGKFELVPEYPEFAWQEGIVNAVTHREYGMVGNYIMVTMYDDRLEIQSPGKLPNLVTVNNIKETRYSRNPRIARVLTEFGWVRELNEGVKRIYSDMADLFLEDPIYVEPDQTVKLVLKNNIVMRSMRLHDRTLKNIGSDTWKELDSLERTIVSFMSNRKQVTKNELVELTQKSASTITNRLKKLMRLEIICRNGNRNDPKQTYSIAYQSTEE